MTQQCFVLMLVNVAFQKKTLGKILKRKCPCGSCKMQMTYIFQLCKLCQEEGIKPLPVNELQICTRSNNLRVTLPRCSCGIKLSFQGMCPKPNTLDGMLTGRQQAVLLSGIILSGKRQAIFPSACIFIFTNKRHRDFLLPLNQGNYIN